MKFSKKDVFTIPNLLSFVRLVLAGMIFYISWHWGLAQKRMLIVCLVLISAVTDMLDGKIARKYHMVSEFGKILDPIADKVTQGVLLICLWQQSPLVKPVLILFLIKEAYMAIMGMKVISTIHVNDGAKWYGKVNTVIFYVIMAILVLIPDIPQRVVNLLFTICGFRIK